MSLIAWWPLNGNLQDIVGRNDLVNSNTSTNTVTSDGLVEKTYTNTSHTTGILYSKNKINLGMRQSMFCWINPTQFYGASSLMAVGGQHRYPSCTGMGITTRYLSSSTGLLSVNTGRGSDRTYNYYCSTTVLNAGTWYHVGYTFDNGVLCLYINGKKEIIKLDGSSSTGTTDYTDSTLKAMSIVEDFFGAFMWSFNAATVEESTPSLHGNYTFYGKINDFRIYDHVLSTKEVEDLYNLCILHYNFNQDCIENTTNLITSDVPKYTAGGVWGTGSVCSVAQDYTNYSVPSGTARKMTYKLTQGGGYAETGGQFSVSGSTTYTISTYIRPPDDFTYAEPNFIYIRQYKSDGAQISESGHFNKNNTIPVGDGWYRCWATYTTNSAATKLAVQFYEYNYTGKEETYWLSSPQIELGSRMTAWVNGSRNTSTVYDSSGYLNHGTMSSVTLSSDTNIGVNSAVFNGSNSYINCGSGAKAKYQITVNIWAKGGNIGDGRLISCTEGAGWNFENSGGYLQFPCNIKNVGYKTAKGSTPVSTLNNGKWHMVTGVFDGTNVKIYIDGNCESTVAAGGTEINYITNSIFVGMEATSSASAPSGGAFNGSISEVEIFARALTPETIMSKYKSSLRFLENHAVQGFLMHETNTNKAEKMNEYIFAGGTNYGVYSYTQSNCSVTDPGDGTRRIYRTPNVNPTDNGNTMWGGLRLCFLDLGAARTISYTNTSTNASASYSESDFFIKNHRYRISFHVKGHSNNAPSSIGFTNNMGWGGGGLDPRPSDVVYKYTPANFGIVNGTAVGDEMDCFYEFTITDDIYKRCTSAYSSFTVGTIYPSYRDFMFGFGYENTGTHGTDLYISNIVCEDITAQGNKTNTPIGATGEFQSRSFIERNYGDTPVTLSDSGDLITTKVCEVGDHLGSTVVNGNIFSRSMKANKIEVGHNTNNIAANILSGAIKNNTTSRNLVTLAQVKAYVDEILGS